MPQELYLNRLAVGMHVHDVVTGLYGRVTLVEQRQYNNYDDYVHIIVDLENNTTVEGIQNRFNEVSQGIIRLSEVDPIPGTTPYAVDVHLNFLEKNLELLGEGSGLNLDPDFQRGHVWNTEQQKRFVEYRLRGGLYGRDIWFNSVNWGRKGEEEVQIIDGLQRLTAMRLFLKNEMKAFGQTYAEFHAEDQRQIGFSINTGLRFHVNNLPTRAAILKWYLDLNAGGTPHTAEEILRVRGLLENALT